MTVCGEYNQSSVTTIINLTVCCECCILYWYVTILTGSEYGILHGIYRYIHRVAQLRTPYYNVCLLKNTTMSVF